jgi:hypothetical protein
MADRDGHLNRPRHLQSLRLLTEDAQLETKLGNDGDPSQSEASKWLGSPSPSRVEMGATRADLSLGVGTEIARPALRRRLAGEGPPAQKIRATGMRGRGEMRPARAIESHAHRQPAKCVPLARLDSDLIISATVIQSLFGLPLAGSGQTPRYFVICNLEKENIIDVKGSQKVR